MPLYLPGPGPWFKPPFSPGAPPGDGWTQSVDDTGTLADAVANAPAPKVADAGTWADARASKPVKALTDTGTLADASGRNVLKTPKPARYFQGSVAANIDTNPGASAGVLRGACTILTVCRPRLLGGNFFTIMGGTTAPTTDGPWYLYIVGPVAPGSTTGQLHSQMTSAGNVNSSSDSPTLRAPHDQWCVIAFTKASGTATPRWHLWTQGAGWQHEDGNAASIPPTADVTLLMHAYTAFITTKGYKALDATWTTAMSDSTIEALPFNTEGLLTTSPAGLWEFPQNSSSDAVNDLTGGGATVTSSANTTYSRAPGLPWRYSQDYGPYDDLDERPSVADAVANKPRKALADGATIADTVVHFWQAVQTVAESGVWTEAVSKKPGKGVADTGTWADFVSQLVGHAFSQSVPDTGTWADALSRKPGKGLAETFALADARALTARKGVADTGTLVDNFSFGGGLTKQVADTLAVADALLKAPKHPLADTATWADARGLKPGKGLADTGTWADARSLKPGKSLADSFALADALAKAPRKTIADAMTVIDQAFPGGGKIKVVGDTFAMADAILKGQTKPLADAIAVADAVSRRPGLVRADTATWADALAFASTHAFFQLVADALTITDLALPALGDILQRIARLFELTRALVTRETEAVVAYNSDATTPIRETDLDATGYASGVSAVAYATEATADAYETGIIVVETDLELT